MVVYTGNNLTIVLENNDSGLTVTGNYNHITVKSSTSSIVVTGTNNVLTVTTSTASIVVTEVNNIVTVTTSSSSIVVTGANSTARVTTLTANAATLLITGANSNLRVKTSNADILMTGADCTMDICDNYSSARINGANGLMRIGTRHSGDSVSLIGAGTHLVTGQSIACSMLLSSTSNNSKDVILARARRSLLGEDGARGLVSGYALDDISSDSSGLVAFGGASAALVLIAVAGVLFARRSKRSHSPAHSPPSSSLVYPPHNVTDDYYMTKEENFSLPKHPSTPMDELKDGMILDSIESEICYQKIPSQCRFNTFSYPSTRPKPSVHVL